MVKEVTGYKWVNENAANSAEAVAKVFYGYPTHPDNTTTEAFEALHNTGSEGDFWYYDEILEPLGSSITFTINIEE